MKCRECGHRRHGHGRCAAKRCKCWPPIDISEVYHRSSGRVRKAGEMLIDPAAAGWDGGYYEIRDLAGEKLQWGSFATFLGDLGLFARRRARGRRR